MNCKLLVIIVMVAVFCYQLFLSFIRLRSEKNRIPDNVSDVYEDHVRVLSELAAAFQTHGLYITGLTYSPVTGGSGNIEYLALLERTPDKAVAGFKQLVDSAFDAMLRK